MNSTLLDEARKLPIKERVQLIEGIWTSLVDDGYLPEITDAQADELDRRLAEHQQTPDDVVSWDTIKLEMKAKYGWTP
jgi:putative addiction module component (TIGR02574 family)